MPYHVHNLNQMLLPPGAEYPASLVIGEDGTLTIDYRMELITPYVLNDTYYPQQTVLVDGWTMCANKETSDYPAPTPIGSPFFVYQGTMLETSDTASQVIFGNRYPINGTGYIEGYRVYTVTGNHYNIYTVTDPLGIPIINQLSDFTATTTGWVNLALTPIFVGGSVVVDLVAVVNEPAPTPVEVVAEYIYSTPQNASPPATGVIIQGRSTPDVMRINYTDNADIDRTALIQGLSIGDIIIAENGGQWTVQGNTDGGNYAFINVSPASTGGTGTQDFTFETVAPTPIGYSYDLDYWAASSFPFVQGLLGIDTAYGDIVPNNNAYGLDIAVQYATVSDDWDVVAPADSNSANSAAASLSDQDVRWVQASSTKLRFGNTSTTDTTWTEIARFPIDLDTGVKGTIGVDAKRTDAYGGYNADLTARIFNNGGTFDIDFRIEELGETQLDVRVESDGGDVVFEVKGRNNQDWDWGIAIFFRDIT